MTDLTKPTHTTKPEATKPAGAPKPAPTYPRLAYIREPGTPGYRTVELRDAEAEKVLGVPVFDTAIAAAGFQTPLEQPIPDMPRTNNEEQFVPGKSQLGAPVSSGVFQTAPPVKNVYVKTGVEEGTLALKAVLPEGVDPALLKDATVAGEPLIPAPAPTAPPAHGG